MRICEHGWLFVVTVPGAPCLATSGGSDPVHHEPPVDRDGGGVLHRQPAHGPGHQHPLPACPGERPQTAGDFPGKCTSCTHNEVGTVDKHVYTNIKYLYL